MGQLRSYISAKKGLGLFLKKDNTLVSWIFSTEWGGLGMLQTHEEHRRKGYGKIVTQAMMKKLAEENHDPILFILESNKTSQMMFESLGFTQLAKNTWVVVKS